MSQEVYLTRAGFEKLSAEFENLKNVERPKISKAIGEARLLGDLSENAEYHAAKEAQSHCEARIVDLENTLAGVRIIEDQNIPSDKIYIGAIVTLNDLDSNEELKYMLVAPQESDFEEKKLSIFSPIGKGLMGHAVGDEVQAEAPAGIINYKILKIERP